MFAVLFVLCWILIGCVAVFSFIKALGDHTMSDPENDDDDDFDSELEDENEKDEDDFDEDDDKEEEEE